VIICPTCRFDNRDDAAYCGMCGTRLCQPCPTCSYLVPIPYRFCIRCGGPLPVPHTESEDHHEAEQEASRTSMDVPPSTQVGSALEGERRVATIILADVQGSTNLLERLGSEAWVKMMNHVFQLLEREVYRFGGKVDQFRGDGLVAFFGTVVAHEDDPERAVLAGLAMQKAIAAHSRELAAQSGVELWLRVGINTGEVIVASIGDQSRYSEETAMGEAVALAARLEALAEPGTVLASENTYRLTEEAFEWLPLGSVQVKGISQPIKVYKPMAQRPGSEHLADFGLSSELIGRQGELRRLVACIDELHEGIGSIVLLVGERGMGKSVLLSEVRRHFARQRALHTDAHPSGTQTEAAQPSDGMQPPSADHRNDAIEFRELRGRARSYDQAQPYTMWQDLIREWLGTIPDEPRARTARRLEERLAALLGERAPEYYPDIAGLLSLLPDPTAGQQLGRQDADSLRQRLFVAVRGWVEAQAQESPLVITFSDVHWADATSLDLLRYCLPICDYESILWLLVFRPDRAAPIWEFRHHVETEYPHRVTSITLNPLTSQQSEDLVDQLVGKHALPDATRELIVSKAEGNPYYIQEFIRSLIADGVLQPVSDADGTTLGWQAKQVATSISVPDSLQSLLLARIDRLPPEQQRVLQTAAVIGPVFWHSVLGAVAPDVPNLVQHVTALQRAELIAERGRIPVLGTEYVFRSNLIRDAAYDSLLSTQRALYHLRTAEYLEALSRSDASVAQHTSYHSTLAYHYRHADQPDRELHYTMLSARQAVELHAHIEARAYYTRALDLLDHLDGKATGPAERRWLQRQRFDILLERQRVFYLTGDYAAMRADIAKLLPLARSLPGDTAALIDALLHQPGVGDYHRRDDIERARPLAAEALALSRELDDRQREMESLIAITNQRLALNDPEWHPLAEEALKLARDLNDANFEARILVGLGSIYAFSDEPERSQQYLEAAASLAVTRGVEDRTVQLSLLNLLGLEYERAGEYYRLLTEYQEERLRISREIGNRPIESRALQACGRIQGIYLGDYQAALSTLEECRRIDHDTPDEIYPLFHVAHIKIEQGDLEMATAILEQAESIGEPVQDRARASQYLVMAMLQNSYGHREANTGHTIEARRRYCLALSAAEQAATLARSNSLVSRQYEMAAMCKATLSHLGLASLAADSTARGGCTDEALAASTAANNLYQDSGFAQIVECVSEEVLYCHSLALGLAGQTEQAARYLKRAYDETMRKHALLPQESTYRRTYLEQIPLHQEIRRMYTNRLGVLLGEAGEGHVIDSQPPEGPGH